MKFFLDTEFLESGRSMPLQLVSIGIVCENGHEFYAVSSDFNPDSANDWVKANVLPHLSGERHPIQEIAVKMLEFINLHRGESKPEFWGYYSDYDWVVFCQMFGTMMDLPKGFPMYCRDLKQWCDDLGNPKLPEQVSTEHNALCDARWNREVFDFLRLMDSSI